MAYAACAKGWSRSSRGKGIVHAETRGRKWRRRDVRPSYRPNLSIPGCAKRNLRKAGRLRRKHSVLRASIFLFASLREQFLSNRKVLTGVGLHPPLG